MELTIILVLLIVWAIVTLLGHGTWVVLASLFRSSQPPRDTHTGRSLCPRCRSPLDTAMIRCSVCGWPNDVGVRTDEQAALRSLRQQLVQFGELKAVDPQTLSTLRTAIEAEESRLTQLKSAKAVEIPTRAAVDILKPEAASTSLAPKSAPVTAAPPTPHAPRPLSERARDYAASREAAADEPVIEPTPPLPKKREAISRLLSAFMEQKNIRWGELVGGLLIVGCSVALVISFWAQIASQPILKFVLFNGVTAALFGIGLYTDRRWKLHTTSHGILVIATLLVPLNFLAIAAFTQGSPPTDVWSLGGEAVSVVVFAVLVYLAGQVIAPGTAVLLAVGVLLPSVMQLLIRRWADPAASLTELYALAAVPVASYLASTGLVMRRRVLEPPLDELAAHRLMVFLGVVSAASLVPLALLAFKVPPIWETIHRLSPLVVWCGVPGLLAGLLFWRHLTDRRLAGVQTAGVAIGVLGAAIMAGAVVAAWPDPATLLPVALMNVVALTAVAFWFGIPAALVPAGLALAGAWLITFHLVRGDVTWTLPNYEPMARALLTAGSGHALVPLVGVFGAITWLLRRMGRRDDSRMIAITAGIVIVGSLALVMWFGFARAGDPQGAFWTLAIYALVTLAAAAVTNLPALAWVGPALLLAAVVQGIAFRWSEPLGLERPNVVALIVHAALMVAGVAAARWYRRGQNNLRVPFEWWAVVTSVAAAGLVAAEIRTTATGSLAAYVAWIGALWLVLSILSGWSALFTVAQFALAFAIACGVTAAVEARPWYAAARHPWLDPWFLQAQGIALAAFCLTWSGARWVFARATHERAESVLEVPAPGWLAAGSRLLNPVWPTVDQFLEVGLPALFVLIALYAAVPGVGQELSPLEAPRGSAPAVRVVTPINEYQIAGVDHTHAADRGAWLFGLAAVAVIAAGIARRHAIDKRICGLLVVLAMACPLVAARWEPDVAVASALRWLSAGFFFVASIPIWLRDRWPASQLADAAAPAAVAQKLRDILVGIIVLLYLAMGTYVAQAALRFKSIAAPLGASLPYIFVWALVGGAAAIAIGFAASPQPASSAYGRGLTRRAGGRSIRDVLLLLAFGPLAVWFAFAVASALDQHPIVGPELTSWFRTIGWDVSYGVPLAVIALGLVGYAIRDRSSGFAFGAGLLANVVATIVILLRLARGGGSLDSAAWITVAQVNAIVAGVVALVWLAAVAWQPTKSPREIEPSPSPSLQGRGKGVAWPLLLVTQAALAAALCGTFILPAAAQTGWSPWVALPWVVQAGSTTGWVALALAIVAAAWIQWRRPAVQATVAFFAGAIVGMLALTAWRWDTGSWEAYHTLLAGVCAAAWLVPLATSAINRFSSDESGSAVPLVWSAISARCFAIVAVVLAIRALDGDPAAPWWTIGALAAMSARSVWIAWYEGRYGFMWIAAILADIAVSTWWIEIGYQRFGSKNEGEILEFFWVNVLAAAAMAVLSVLVELPSNGATVDDSRLRRWMSFHRFAAWAIAVLLLLTTAVGLFADVRMLPRGFQDASVAMQWGAWVAALAAAMACWWDARSRWPVACLYTVGLVAVGMYLDGLNFEIPMIFWALAMALAAYSLLTSFLWSRRGEIAGFLARLSVPITGRIESGHYWLVTLNGLSAVFVLLLVALIEIQMPEFQRRMVAAYAVGAEGLALALLARGAVRSSLQYSALVFGVLFAVAFGWAWLPPDFPAPWLHRTIAAVAALALVLVLYGFGLVKLLRRENEWTRAAQQLVPLLAAVAALLLLLVMGIEVSAYATNGEVPIAWQARLAVAIALIGLAVAGLVAAIVPGRDPLGLSERGRTAYVYAAEVLVGLTFLHIRVTMPWLFTGWFLRFWPFVVMAIAFVGVGLGEFFRRRRQNVLSQPLATTGSLLPLLPALGFWMTPSEVHYSLLLLSVGVLYAAVSALRKSFLYTVLAALAANGSLWYLLHTQEGLSITHHPQLWLIPPALCMLAAGYLNRARLSPEQSAALRYGSAIVIYVSSTADVFINGVADAPWLPAVLAGLSILGVFAGILLRVRAFLYLGTAFLMVAILTIIWYAAVEQQRTWILWVAGIVTGVLIIALFGVFEKRRDDVLRMVERLKQWEA